MKIDVDQMIKGNEDVWTKFIPHPYMIKVLKDPNSLNTWVLEDYHFVKGAVRFMLTLTSKAPDKYLDFLLESTYHLAQKELPIFRDISKDLGVNLDRDPSMTTLSYVSFLNHLALSQDFVYGVVGLFAEEWAYHEAWKWFSGKSEDPMLRRLSSHWSSTEFGKYVDRLRSIIEESQGDQGVASRVFRDVCRFELLFWDSVNGVSIY